MSVEAISRRNRATGTGLTKPYDVPICSAIHCRDLAIGSVSGLCGKHERALKLSVGISDAVAGFLRNGFRDEIKPGYRGYSRDREIIEAGEHLAEGIKKLVAILFGAEIFVVEQPLEPAYNVSGVNGGKAYWQLKFLWCLKGALSVDDLNDLDDDHLDDDLGNDDDGE